MGVNKHRSICWMSLWLVTLVPFALAWGQEGAEEEQANYGREAHEPIQEDAVIISQE